ncbi:MAG: site-specific integrase [Blautia sp.]|nr:site-specific integrase [Blautia sp.]
MARKGENIHKRKDGRWEARYRRGRDAEGRIIYGYVYGRSYREARFLRNQRLGIRPGPGEAKPETAGVPADATFTEIIPLWQKEIRYTVKDSTWSCYETMVQRHIIPVLGGYAVRQFTNQMLHEFIEELYRCGLGAGTVNLIETVLRQIIRYAEGIGIRTAEALSFPKVKNARNDIRLLDEEQYRTLYRYLEEHMDLFNLGLMVCFHTGLRVGELSGLRWEDFDLEKDRVFIRRTVSRIRNIDRIPDPVTNRVNRTVVSVRSPKSVNSIREIPLPDRLAGLLREMKGNDPDYLVTGSQEVMEPRIIQRKYGELLQQLSITPVKIHGLRHQFSCRWMEQGYDAKSLSEILGHRSVRTTLDVYVHSRDEKKRSYMNQMNRMMDGSQDTGIAGTNGI